ncbi:ribonuclease H2, subunit B [Ochromonadaceae sp. CCMP2298]|nr:ribonuclease H2, subunit B [Ochromonadaceae sp. CCMP2298]
MATVPSDIVMLLQRGPGQPTLLTGQELNLKSFPHPKGYDMLVLDLDNELYEVQVAQPRKHGSWFINQRVCSSGSIHLVSKLDPRFLCLPFLAKSTKYSPLDQVVHLPEQYARFPFGAAGGWKLHEICDVNDKLGDDMILYRYNESKVLAWLQGKVARTAQVLMRQRLAGAGATDPLFVSGFNSAAAGVGAGAGAGAGVVADSSIPSIPLKEDVLQALEVVTDYLTPALADTLLRAYAVTAADLAAPVAGQKRKTDWELELELERETLAYSSAAVTSASAPGELGAAQGAVAKAAASASAAAKSKANQAAAKGTRSLFSFFGAKK